MYAEQVLLVLSEEEILALGGEADGAVATDLAEGRLGASEETDEGDEVDHFEISLNYNDAAWIYMMV